MWRLTIMIAVLALSVGLAVWAALVLAWVRRVDAAEGQDALTVLEVD